MNIRTEQSQGVLHLQFDRPERKNALTQGMYQAAAEALAQARQDSSVRAVLLSGAGGSFTAGNDLEDFLRNPPRSLDSPTFAFMRALVDVDKPVVAAVEGAAVGIGTTLLLHCDLVYIADTAKLRMPFTHLGLCAEFASSLLLPQRAGQARAAEKLLLADAISPTDAVELRIATAVLPAAEVLAHAQQQALRLASLPVQAVQTTRRLMHAPNKEAVHATIAAEAKEFSRLLETPEAKEAFTAFFEKRAPDFSKFLGSH